MTFVHVRLVLIANLDSTSDLKMDGSLIKLSERWFDGCRRPMRQPSTGNGSSPRKVDVSPSRPLRWWCVSTFLVGWRRSPSILALLRFMLFGIALYFVIASDLK
jgi:hypothetical protein